MRAKKQKQRFAANAAAKCQSILVGARKEFLKHGFAGASMDAVAAASGASKMTVYRHFRSKEQLFAGVIQSLCDQIVDEDIAEKMEMLPLDRALRLFAQRTVATVFAPETVELHRIVVAESHRFPKLGRTFYQRGPQQGIDLLSRFLQKNAADPRLKSANPRRSAEEFLSLLRGYTHLRMLLGIKNHRNEIRRAVDSAISHLLR